MNRWAYKLYMLSWLRDNSYWYVRVDPARTKNTFSAPILTGPYTNWRYMLPNF